MRLNFWFGLVMVTNLALAGAIGWFDQLSSTQHKSVGWEFLIPLSMSCSMLGMIVVSTFLNQRDIKPRSFSGMIGAVASILSLLLLAKAFSSENIVLLLTAFTLMGGAQSLTFQGGYNLFIEDLPPAEEMKKRRRAITLRSLFCIIVGLVTSSFAFNLLPLTPVVWVLGTCSFFLVSFFVFLLLCLKQYKPQQAQQAQSQDAQPQSQLQKYPWQLFGVLLVLAGGLALLTSVNFFYLPLREDIPLSTMGLLLNGFGLLGMLGSWHSARVPEEHTAPALILLFGGIGGCVMMMGWFYNHLFLLCGAFWFIGYLAGYLGNIIPERGNADKSLAKRFNTVMEFTDDLGRFAGLLLGGVTTLSIVSVSLGTVYKVLGVALLIALLLAALGPTVRRKRPYVSFTFPLHRVFAPDRAPAEVGAWEWLIWVAPKATWRGLVWFVREAIPATWRGLVWFVREAIPATCRWLIWVAPKATWRGIVWFVREAIPAAWHWLVWQAKCLLITFMFYSLIHEEGMRAERRSPAEPVAAIYAEDDNDNNK